MGKPSKRKSSKGKGKRKMSSARRAAVERIERPKPPKGDQAPAEPQAPKPADPAATAAIARAREVGLSVADDTAVDKVQQMLARHGTACDYVAAVWRSIAKADTPLPPADRLGRFVSSLFDDGRLADQIVQVQQNRPAGATIPRDAAFKRVARGLRERFGEQLGKQGFFARLLGR